MTILLITVLAIILYVLINKAYKNTKKVVINKITIHSESSNKHDPKLKVLQLSDLHLENISISPNELYYKLIDEQVDLITITGDFLDRKRSIPKLAPYLQVLNQLNPKYGIYAVLGNHDYVLRKNNLQKLIDTLEKHNCKVLCNQNDTILVDDTIVNIIGIDDFSTKRADLEASYVGIRNGVNLVLTHDPNIVLKMGSYHFDYLLSGHFHGGQICYPKAFHLVKMGKLPRMKMIKGLHQYNGMPFYINEGLGQTGVNIRIGSRPEITIHELTVRTTENNAIQAI